MRKRPFGSVLRSIELGQVDGLDRGKIRRDRAGLRQALPRGWQSARKPRSSVTDGGRNSSEPRRLRDRRRPRVTRPILRASSGGRSRRPDKQEIPPLPRARCVRASRQEAARREDADLNFRLARIWHPVRRTARCPAALRVRDRRRGIGRGSTVKTGTGEAKICRISRWKACKHRRASIRQMFLDRGPEGKMPAGPNRRECRATLQRCRADRWHFRSRRPLQRRGYCLGAIEPQNEANVRRAQARLSADCSACALPPLGISAFGDQLLDHPSAPPPLHWQGLAARREIDFAFTFRTFV